MDRDLDQTLNKVKLRINRVRMRRARPVYIFQNLLNKTVFHIVHFSADNPGLSAGLGGGAGGEGFAGFVLEQHARQHLSFQRSTLQPDLYRSQLHLF